MTLIYFASLGAVSLLLFWFLFGFRSSLDARLVAQRRIPQWFGGIWMAIAFTWGTTFLYTAMLAYKQGPLGFGFFAFGNTAGLVLAWTLARRVRVPEKKYSISKAIGERYDAKTGLLYALAIMSIQVFYALTLQFVVVAKVLAYAINADPAVTIPAAALAMIALLIAGGIRSSVSIDILKAVMMLGLILVFAPLAISNAGGVEAVIGGIMGRGDFTAQGNAWLWIFTEGVPFVVSLASAGVVDQSLFQRYFSTTSKPTRYLRLSLIAGVVFFVLNMVASASLGFLASNEALGVVIPAGKEGVAGFIALERFAPTLAIFFVLTVMTSFLASGDTALNAASSIFAKDIYQERWFPRASESSVKRAQVIAAAAMLAVPAWAAYEGVGLIDLLIGVGVLRAAFFVPTIAAFFTRKEQVPNVFGAILFAMILSALVYGAGKYCAHGACVLPFASANAYLIAGPLLGWTITLAYVTAVLFRNSRSLALTPAQ